MYSSNGFLTIIRDHARCWQKIMSNFWHKSGRGRLRNSSSVAYEKVFEQEFTTCTNKTVIHKVASYGGDCLGEVVAMRKLTVVVNSTPSTSKIWRDLCALLGGQSYTWQGKQETHS